MPALYQHVEHAHTPRNPNDVHRHEQASGSAMQRCNAQIAVHATVILGSMWCFYAFLLLAGTGFPGVPWLTCTPQAFIAWLSSQLIQLVALPLLGAGTLVLGRKQEIQADETYRFVVKTYHDGEQIAHHLDAQDAELLKLADATLRAVRDGEQVRAMLADVLARLPVLPVSPAPDHDPAPVAASPSQGPTPRPRTRPRGKSTAGAKAVRA